MRLAVIVASTRPGRGGRAVAEWFLARAEAHPGFEPVLVDLAEIDLPLLDEPKHPRLGDYEHGHTRRWSATVDAADAFVFVTPEYNYSAAPSLMNALDYLSREWRYKPAGFVSYGGVSGGTRSVEVTKQVLTTLKVMPIPEAVTVPFYRQHLQGDTFEPGEVQEKAAEAMLDELRRWAEALRPMRQTTA